MKVAYIVPSLRQTGPIFVVNNLCHFLLDLGVNVDVYYFDSICQLKFDCPTIQIDSRDPISFDNYDIIHSHCFRADKYVYHWRKRIVKAKIVTTLHQDTYESFRYDYNIAISYLLTRYWCYMQSNFNGVISISNQLRDKYQKLLKGKAYTIYNGVNIQMEGSVNTLILDKIRNLKVLGYKLLGTYAFIVKRKGIIQVLDTLSQKSDYAFVIIGDGPEKKHLVELAEEKGLNERVLFIDHINQPYAYMTDIDVYVMPSYSEGFGLAMVEAALVGKAIVCSNLPSFHEIFTDDEASFFELDNIDSLIGAIDKTFSNITSYRENAYKKVDNFFTAKVMSENYLKYYYRLLES